MTTAYTTWQQFTGTETADIAALYAALSTDATELVLFAENTEPLYAQFQSIIDNLTRKIDKGTYRPELAPKLWRYWTDAAAKAYKREHGYQFPPAIRQEAAEYFAATEYVAIVNGEYR